MPFLLQVYIDSPIILNGVCLRWKGYINLEKLDGVGGMKFDEDSARVSRFYSQFCAAWKFPSLQIEDAIMQQQVESYKHALRDWDEQQQRHRAALQQARSASSQLTSTPSTEEQQQQHTVTTAWIFTVFLHFLLLPIYCHIRTKHHLTTQSYCQKKIPTIFWS